MEETISSKMNKETLLHIPIRLACIFHGDDRLQILLALLSRQAAIVAV